MNMKTITAGVFLASILFVSCKKELQPQESTETLVVEAASTEPQNIEKQFEVQNQNTQTVQEPSPVQTQPVATAPGMNPPHGQPNHRCDIAVGAPLNSPKAATSPPSTTVQQPTPQGQASITPVDMASGTTATKPGMNPPHGQEGHRCEVAVGAPLPK
jgi:hypothetical protein